MSSKNAPDLAPPPQAAFWSLAARLTAWYAGSSFLLVLAATSLLYWLLLHSVDQEDDRTLGDKARVVRVTLQEKPDDWAALRQEVEGGWDARHTQVYVRILDGRGKTVTETPGMAQELPANLFPSPTSEPGTGKNFDSDSGGSFRLLAVRTHGQPAESGIVIQVAMNRSQEVEILTEYRKNLWGVLGAALLVCTLVGYQIARRGIQPLTVVTDTARRIQPSNLGERIAAAGLPSELFALADTFNRMLDRLEQSFARLSRFSADIAHELRTPVNNLRGEVEVALARPRNDEEYREVLGSNLEECGRLTRMIDSLLFLARAEHPQTQIQKEGVELGGELETIREFYEAIAGEKEVKLTAVTSTPIHAELDRPLFQRAVGNLVENALAHTAPGGSVALTARTNQDTTVVEVADTGCGIAAQHLPHLFDRFYRADRARSSVSGNVGLGLAIVKGIVELHGGSVTIHSEPGRGTHVLLSFPHKMTKL